MAVGRASILVDVLVDPLADPLVDPLVGEVRWDWALISTTASAATLACWREEQIQRNADTRSVTQA
jgi:hypothetical protein